IVGALYHCMGTAQLISCCRVQLTADRRTICWLIIYSALQILIWLVLSYATPNRADRMLASIYQDQRKWLELTSVLVNELLSGTDPRVHTVLKDHYEFKDKGKQR